ncbi:MAG: hypothetical protein CMJ32_00095 [Phycisphaerae bacterium]|nr:hypothetical protein [Phycisphaerae bacterium]
MTYSRQPRALSDRFWEKVHQKGSDECWEWTGAVMSNGYGVIKEGSPSRKMITAHRVSAAIHFGPLKPSDVVCHSCDNRRCVNPDHLRIGTQSENIREAVARGRYVRRRHARVLSDQQADEIRTHLGRGRLTQSEIGALYGVQRQVVTQIARGKTYQSKGANQ